MLSVNSVWFAEYIATELGDINDCSVAKIEKNSTVALLGTPTKDLYYDDNEIQMFM